VRILVLSNLYPPDFLGGYELVCAQAVDALRARGHEVCVLTSAARSLAPAAAHVRRLFQMSEVYDYYSTSHLTPLTYKLMQVRSSFINAHNVHSLLVTLESFQPDVVYLHNLLGLGGLGLLGCLHHLRIPWVWQLGDCVPRQLCSLGTVAVPALVAEYNRQLRGHYVACSRRLIDEIQAVGLRLDGQFEVLPNWVTTTRSLARREYFRGGRLRIVSAGQIGPHKGTDLLIQTATRLRELGYENFKFDMYGNVTDSLFQCHIDRCGLRPWVTLQGPRTRDELDQLFAEYDVFAFPTWAREPFGVAPLEAAAWGCVPVMSQCCGIAEWLVHGVHCLKAPRTVAGFTRVFADILDGKIDLQPLARRVSTTVRRDFHLAALLPSIERALVACAARPRAGAGSTADAYQLALLAERSAQALVHDSLAA
jgi:glycosyltransferase involved in cell wall biosynthesis